MLSIHHKTLLTIFVIAIFGVLTHWSVWSEGIYTLGWNTSLYWIGVWYLLLSQNNIASFKHDWLWLLPLWLIVISFALYENPWLKFISAMCLPLLTGIFYTFGQLENRYGLRWNHNFLMYLVYKTLSPYCYLRKAIRICQDTVSNSLGTQHKSISRRVLLGIFWLVPIAVCVLTLLVAADEIFSEFVSMIWLQVSNFITLETAGKFALIVALSIMLLAMTLGWCRQSGYSGEVSETRIDDIVASIVLGGILIIYLTFLYLQLEYLLVRTLPVNLSQTEHLVKSGFWQLFFLSILNVILFFYTYTKTGTIGQIILRIFIAASGLILLSACWRLSMYVYWYGLSYEKFFASYTAIYALYVFVFLLIATFSVSRKNILRFVAFSSLWCYSVASVLPIERIIFDSNYALSKQQNSRVNLFHLSVLSTDIYHGVKTAIIKGEFDAMLWQQWLTNIEKKRCQRSWYETNLSMLLNCSSFLP